MPLTQFLYNSTFQWSENRPNSPYPSTNFGPFTDRYNLPITISDQQVYAETLTLGVGGSAVINFSTLHNFVCQSYKYDSLIALVVKVSGSSVTIGGGVSPVDPFGSGQTVTVPAGGFLCWTTGSELTISGDNLLFTNSGGTSLTLDILLLGKATGISFVTEDVFLTNGGTGALTIGEAVYIFSADTFKAAEANASGTTRAIGLVADNSIAASASGNVRVSGVLAATTSQWDTVAGTTGGLSAGSVLYLSDSTAGHLTATPPSTTGHYVVEIGQALSSTELLINVKAPILL